MFTTVSVKDAQSILQKMITWTNKYGKMKQEWGKTCINMWDATLKIKNPIKTKFSSKVIMF
jgi:hypothetical protein